MCAIVKGCTCHAPACAKHDCWAIRRGWLVQVDRLVSYPLVFISSKVPYMDKIILRMIEPRPLNNLVIMH